MSEEKKKKAPSTAWQKGAPSPNAAGRPKGSGRPVSSLRKTLSKLKSLETKSLENVERSVNGEEVDKEVLSSSKWVCQQIVSVQKACVSEELAVHGIRSDLAGDNEPEEKEDEEPKVRFSLHVLPKKEDLE